MENDKYRLKLLVIGYKITKKLYTLQIFMPKITILSTFYAEKHLFRSF